MEQVRTELKRSGAISLNDADVRKLAGRTLGIISMNDLRGKKASESVTNYQVYNNSWTGYAQAGNFSINFPHKVISGTLIVTSTWQGFNKHGERKGYIELLGQRIEKTTKNISISNLNQITSCTYYTGLSYETDGDTIREYSTTVTVNVKFTGEWEL